MLYDNLRGLFLYEGFKNPMRWVFVYNQDGGPPWFFICQPDPDGQVHIPHVIQNLLGVTTPYLDIQDRLIKALTEMDD